MHSSGRRTQNATVEHTMFLCLRTIQRHGQLVNVTNACDVANGAMWHHTQEGLERVLGYYSKTLSNAQRNDCTTLKELMAIAATLDHWLVRLQLCI